MRISEMLGLDRDQRLESVCDSSATLSRGELLVHARSLASNLEQTVPPQARIGVFVTPGVQGLLDVLAGLLSCRSVALLPTDGQGVEWPRHVALSANCQALVHNGAIEPLAPADDQVLAATYGLGNHDSPERVVLFTSGTTSAPKGVRLSEANLVAHLTAMLRTAVPWRTGDRVGQSLSLSHSFGLSMALLALATRTPLVMLSDGAAPGRRLAESMDANGVTVYACVPYFLRLMATRGIDLGGSNATSLKHLYLAGGGVSDADLAILLPNYSGETYLMYGLTEAMARVAVRRGRDRAPSNSVGLPLPGFHVQVVDSWGDPLPIGDTGRIRVFSPTLMIGYVGEEPRSHGAPLTTTDLGHLDAAGNLFITGREAEMMNFRGNRVSLPAVEALVNGLEGVQNSRLRPDSPEEDSPAQLMIVAEHGADENRIRMAVLRSVVPRGLVRQIAFVDDLPITRSGKAIRH